MPNLVILVLNVGVSAAKGYSPTSGERAPEMFSIYTFSIRTERVGVGLRAGDIISTTGGQQLDSFPIRRQMVLP